MDITAANVGDSTAQVIIVFDDGEGIEDVEVTIRLIVESDGEPEYYEPQYVPNVIDIAANSVANSITMLIIVAAGLFRFTWHIIQMINVGTPIA
jgi:hypothetical protein